jgi:hypothetical protein
VDINVEFVRGCSLGQLDDIRSFLEGKGFSFGVYAEPEGVYYTATHERDLVFVDDREAYSIQSLRDMYTRCLEHLEVEELNVGLYLKPTTDVQHQNQRGITVLPGHTRCEVGGADGNSLFEPGDVSALESLFAQQKFGSDASLPPVTGEEATNQEAGEHRGVLVG